MPSNAAEELANAPKIRSPQISQACVRIGPRDARHASHTGRREKLINGWPHKRQSLGNRTVASPRAAVCSNAANPPEAWDSLRGERIRPLLLLKTTLPV